MGGEDQMVPFRTDPHAGMGVTAREGPAPIAAELGLLADRLDRLESRWAILVGKIGPVLGPAETGPSGMVSPGGLGGSEMAMHVRSAMSRIDSIAEAIEEATKRVEL